MVFGTVNDNDVTFMYSLSRFITIVAGTLIGLIGSLVVFPQFVTPKLLVR
jgi:uncharacterized membrane protein YgaE (UPF0421/DUF939 family)